MILKVFGDESHDETKTRVFALAGVMAPEDVWNVAELLWLERTGGKVFHATECESEFARDADPQKHKDNLKLYADLATIIVQCRLAGWGIAMDLAGYHESFPGTPSDTPYFKGFLELVWALTEMSHRFNAAREPPEAVTAIEFTFDHRRESQYNTGLLYSTLVNRPEWQASGLLGASVSFDSRANPRIQIADLVARETMKQLDNTVGPIRRRMRGAMRVLGTCGRRCSREYRRLGALTCAG